MGRYVLGIDGGTESYRTGVFDLKGRCLGFGICPNENIHRHAGWAEQKVESWDRALIESIQRAIEVSGVAPGEIAGIGVAGTSCTVVCLDESGVPVRDAVMWMDIRAIREAAEIAQTGDPALAYVGHGRVSPEWFPCKALWLKQNEEELFKKTHTIFEHTDWIAYRLTGERCVNINTLSIRWFYNQKAGGFPHSLYEQIGLGGVFDKVPSRIVQIGEVVGGITDEVARSTGLPRGIPVAGGGADAYMGVVGLNVLEPGKLALITGSSQLHIGMTDRELHGSGLFGTFPGAVLPGVEVVEAGQISTGSIINWFGKNFINPEYHGEAEASGLSIYELMDQQAASLPPGSEGLVVLDHWQGNRTPWVDPTSRGVIRGLTLKHTPVHIFRAIMEGVAYGTGVILNRMNQGGIVFNELLACGGATKSTLWMQIHADVTGKPIGIPREPQAVSLGSAIAATVASGHYSTLGEGAREMVAIDRTIEPNLENTERYRPYLAQYEATYHQLKDESAILVESLEHL